MTTPSSMKRIERGELLRNTLRLLSVRAPMDHNFAFTRANELLSLRHLRLATLAFLVQFRTPSKIAPEWIFPVRQLDAEHVALLCEQIVKWHYGAEIDMEKPWSNNQGIGACLAYLVDELSEAIDSVDESTTWDYEPTPLEWLRDFSGSERLAVMGLLHSLHGAEKESALQAISLLYSSDAADQWGSIEDVDYKKELVALAGLVVRIYETP